MLADPVTFNVYDRGYKGGAQTSVFIGPVWVEEVVSIQFNTQTTDIPVYSYSSPYFGKILLGNYQVTGQIGIAYTEPDYLLRIIETAKSTSIREEELRNLIDGRKSIFMNTVKYRMLTEELLKNDSIDLSENVATQYATSYVERITREIETGSLNEKGGLDPQSFEMTVVTGSLHSDTQAIEIYEGVKIIGTGKVITNDDNVQIEVYQFIGRKKPDRIHKVIAPRDAYLLSRPNLMKLASEITRKLVDRLLQPPDFEVFDTRARTSEMLSTDKMAVAGLLPRNPRLYGKEASFGEIVYAVEYAAKMSTYTDDNNIEHNIESTSVVDLYSVKGGQPKPLENTYLTCPNIKKNGRITAEVAFDNRFGRMISPDRENLAKHIAAVAPISPASIASSRGGTIMMPRYQRNEFGIGSYYPPEIVDITAFDYDESGLETLTAGTLWFATLGFRSTSSQERKNMDTTSAEEMKDDKICEVTQPLNTIAVINEVSSDWEEDAETFELKFAAPRAVDFVNLHISGTDGKSAKAEMKVGKSGNYIKTIFSKGGTIFGDSELDTVEFEGPLIEEGEGTRTADQRRASEAAGETNATPGVGWAVFESSRFDVQYQVFDVPDPSSGDPDNLDPHYFESELKLTQPEITATMNKCLYVTPFVFLDGDEIEVSVAPAPENYVGLQIPDKLPSGTPVDNYFTSLIGKKAFERLAYYLKKRNGADDSCNITVAYDTVVADQSGYFDNHQSIKIYGVYFLKTKKDLNTVTCETDGASMSRKDIGIEDYSGSFHPLGFPKKVHVFWITSVMPVLYLPHLVKDEDSGVEVIHSIDGNAGRYVEMYNITRCDAMMHNAQLLVDLNAGIFNTIKNAIINIFKDLLNIDAPVTSYTFPLKAMWERFAGFLTGYSFRLDVQGIVRQLLRCTFTGDMNALVGRTVRAEDDGTTWTLGKALSIAEHGLKSTAWGEAQGEQDATAAPAGALSEEVSDSTFAELSSMIRGTLEEKLKEIGGQIIERVAGKGLMIVDVDVMLPASDVVAFGLTKDGLEELKAMTAYNEQVAGVQEQTIVLGGYEEI